MQSLPNELLIEIISLLDDGPTLRSARLLNKAASSIATPLLFRDRTLSFGRCREESFQRLTRLIRSPTTAQTISGISLSADDLVLSSFWEHDASPDSLWKVLMPVSEKYIREVLELISVAKESLRRTELHLTPSIDLEMRLSEGDKRETPSNSPLRIRAKENTERRFSGLESSKSLKAAKTVMLQKCTMAGYCFARIASDILRSSAISNSTSMHLEIIGKEDDIARFFLLKPPPLNPSPSAAPPSLFLPRERDWSLHEHEFHVSLFPPLPPQRTLYNLLRGLKFTIYVQSGPPTNRTLMALHSLFRSGMSQLRSLEVKLARPPTPPQWHSARCHGDAYFSLDLSHLPSLERFVAHSDVLLTVDRLCGTLESTRTLRRLEVRNVRIRALRYGSWADLFGKIELIESLESVVFEGLGYTLEYTYDPDEGEDVGSVGELEGWEGYKKPFTSRHRSDFEAFRRLRDVVIGRRREKGLERDEWLEGFCGSEGWSDWMGEQEAE